MARTVCENLPWRAPNGQLRVEACLALLEQLADVVMIRLPAKQARAGYRSPSPRGEPLPVRAVAARLVKVRPITVEPVPATEQASWDATMAKYHPLGFQRAFGAQQRYWIRGEIDGEPVILGALLFAAAARHVAVRDAWLGWTREQQQRFRYRIVANSRYLILPGVQVPHLVSHALSLALGRLRDDWQARYGYGPVVLETFVAPPWRGTCYRAANWLHLGQTTGQGRQDRQYAQGCTIQWASRTPNPRHMRAGSDLARVSIVVVGLRRRPTNRSAGNFKCQESTKAKRNARHSARNPIVSAHFCERTKVFCADQ